MASATETGKKKRRVAMDAIQARVELVNGNFELPPEALQAMRAVREAASVYAHALEAITKAQGLKYDTGRIIAALDAIQLSKDTACVALILPHASVEVPDDA